MRPPNVIIVFADQWRAQACGYAGNEDVLTPHLDMLAEESVNFSNAVSGCPVCSPYRASLMTGQYPLTHGVFVNDVQLGHTCPSVADAFAGAGYDTAYIGKWHLNGHGRSSPIPPDRRQGFDYWKVLECTHDYNHSAYYEGDSTQKRYWSDYDAIAQTDDALRYIENHSSSPKPFFMVLSWGPPHAPYETAPAEFRAMYSPDSLNVPPNVPESMEGYSRAGLAGYYAHCSVLDHCVGRLLSGLKSGGIDERTIFLFTSDHGDMLGAHGAEEKQQPYDESVCVPFLLRYPQLDDWNPRLLDAPIDAPDVMPTLLGLADIDIPESVEGTDFSDYIAGRDAYTDGAAILTCPHPFGTWNKPQRGGREYRGLRTTTHTYVRDLNGPWLLFDNQTDPFQLHNLVENPQHRDVVEYFDCWLHRELKETGDDFRPGLEYMKAWKYPMNRTLTVPFSW
jgi:arylsulfatase A-like enzyme